MNAHEAHEHHEHAEHAAHSGGHEGSHRANGKLIALLISVLAALLAIVESGASSAQNKQMSYNIQASDTWAYYQAKTIRHTLMLNAADALEASAPQPLSPEQATRIKTTTDGWRSEAARLDSDPKGNEGRKELVTKARGLEEQRDEAGNAFHNFEYGGAALQLAIALASASVVTGMPALAIGSCVLGVVGATLGTLGWVAPDMLHHILSEA